MSTTLMQRRARGRAAAARSRGPRAALHAAARKPVPARRAQVHALNGVSVQIDGRARASASSANPARASRPSRALVMALERPTSGSVQLLGRDLHRICRRRAAPRAARFPDGVPGSLRLARSAPDRRAHRRRAADRARRMSIAPTQRARVAAVLKQVGLARRRHGQVSARILRRPAPAHRDRARADHPAEADRRRRAGQRARRLGAGAGAQSAAGPAGRSSA